MVTEATRRTLRPPPCPDRGYVDRMTEIEIPRGDRLVRVRDAGDPHGRPLVYLHGTPGSRLDVAFADEVAASSGVRLVSLDRPGYGGSTPSRFGLVSVAHDVAAVADSLGLERFATLGQSGGGPFSLACAAILGDRVTRAGVASGPGPFTVVPGALDALDDGDKAALALLPDDPEGAARGFGNGFEPLVPLCRGGTATEIAAGFGDLLSTKDKAIMSDDRLAAAFGTGMKESMRQGTSGAAWDNVAWVGPWEIDPTTIGRPVLLWYGDEDRFCPPAHGVWLRDNVPGAQLEMRAGEGHLGFMEHTAELFGALTS